MKEKILFILVIVLFRFLLEYNSNINLGHIMPNILQKNESKNWEGSINVDDNELCDLGNYFLTNKKFITNISFDRPKFREDTIWITALRNQFYVLYFSGLIYTYNSFSYDVESYNLDKHKYLQLHSKIFFVAKWLIFLVSLIFGFKILRIHFSDNLSFLGTIILALYPSTFYVLSFNTFDSLGYSLSIIVLGLVFFGNKLVENKILYYSFLSIFTLFTCLAKLHLMILIIFCSFLILACTFFNRKKYKIKLTPQIVAITICFFVYSLCGYINYRNSGHFIISTQSGINFFHGHNPIAKGSWNGNIWAEYSSILNPILSSHISKLKSDEYTESNEYKKIAFEWIIENPMLEFKLILKKIGIFFFPHNFLSWDINIITLIMHLSFFVFLIISFKDVNKDIPFKIFVITPIISILLLNIIFFVEYRWRFYIDGFFVFSFIAILEKLANLNVTQKLES
jgi:hypothetical protein